MSIPIRRMILMKPMQTGVSGYARVQTENGRALVQLHARGLQARGVKLYWYLSGQRARELAEARVNARGEASLEAEAPDDALAPGRLQALILLSADQRPAPLLIGLCTEQSAGSLLDAKNAALALCQQRASQASPVPLVPEASSSTQASPVSLVPEASSSTRASQPTVRRALKPELPREIFLPALDPQPYIPAREQPAPMRAQRRNAPPVDRLRPLKWPRGFEKLRPYFENAKPCALFDLPGWRFVCAAHAGGPDGLWLGMRQIDGRVCRLAYAVKARTPPSDAPYRPALGLDGEVYQVLWQEGGSSG